ncbi:MAG: CD0415/CD1112 family protein [Clostridia bacterium]
MNIISSFAEVIKTGIIQIITIFISGVLDNFNTSLTEVLTDISKTPNNWNSSIYSMVNSITNNVIMPIAGMILAFIMTYDFIEMIINKNNMNEVGTADIFKWIVKTYIGVMLVTNSLNIVIGIFEVGEYVVNNTLSIINTSVTLDENYLGDFLITLEDLTIPELLIYLLQSIVLRCGTFIITCLIVIVIYVRMIEIYLRVSLAPITLATTMGGNSVSPIGQNYIKSIFAFSFQAFLITLCIGIYAVLIRNVSVTDNPISYLWECLLYMCVLVFTLTQTGNISKSIFSSN